MKKATSKILMAAMSLIIAIGLATGTTFAWFSMNTKVTVDGMSVTTKVSSNILISETTTEDSFAATLSQARTGKLEPVSTTTGTSFFYTKGDNVKGNGDAKVNEYVLYSEATELTNNNAGKTNYDAAFQTAYGVTASITTDNVIYGYIDYTFYLKATNANESGTQALKMTKCNLLVGGAALTATDDTAWRVALLSSAAADTAGGIGDVALKTIITPSDAVNFTSGEAVTSTTATGAVTYGTADAATIDAALAAQTTKYYKVIVRLWLEGEDSNCNNDTYANLTSAYTLGLEFELGTATPAVTVIGPVVPTP